MVLGAIIEDEVVCNEVIMKDKSLRKKIILETIFLYWRLLCAYIYKSKNYGRKEGKLPIIMSQGKYPTITSTKSLKEGESKRTKMMKSR